VCTYGGRKLCVAQIHVYMRGGERGERHTHIHVLWYKLHTYTHISNHIYRELLLVIMYSVTLIVAVCQQYSYNYLVKLTYVQ
jgi:hypothetical protein